MSEQSAKSHAARKALFHNGIQRGYLTIEEINESLPPANMSPAERWLLFYSLRAADIEIQGNEV